MEQKKVVVQTQLEKDKKSTKEDKKKKTNRVSFNMKPPIPIEYNVEPSRVSENHHEQPNQKYPDTSHNN